MVNLRAHGLPVAIQMQRRLMHIGRDTKRVDRVPFGGAGLGDRGVSELLEPENATRTGARLTGDERMFAKNAIGKVMDKVNMLRARHGRNFGVLSYTTAMKRLAHLGSTQVDSVYKMMLSDGVVPLMVTHTYRCKALKRANNMPLFLAAWKESLHTGICLHIVTMAVSLLTAHSLRRSAVAVITLLSGHPPFAASEQYLEGQIIVSTSPDTAWGWVQKIKVVRPQVGIEFLHVCAANRNAMYAERFIQARMPNFDSVPQPVLTALMEVYASCGDVGRVLTIFNTLSAPDERTYYAVLKALHMSPEPPHRELFNAYYYKASLHYEHLSIQIHLIAVKQALLTGDDDKATQILSIITEANKGSLGPYAVKKALEGYPLKPQHKAFLK